MKAQFLAVLLGLSTFFSLPTWAAEADGETDTPDAPAPAKAEKGETSEKASNTKDGYSHAMQFGLRAGLVGGYNMIFRYDQSPLCTPYASDKDAKDQQKVCGHAAPLALDIAASFAPLDFVEPYVFLRLGLTRETQTDTQPLKAFGVGARIYTVSDSAFKVFVEPALAYEFEKGGNSPAFQQTHPDYKSDLLLHLAVGPQFDFAKYVGAFIDGGLTTGILRDIHTELELQLGLQARFP